MNEQKPRRRVLVVGIDGVRYDTLLAAATPNLDRLGAGRYFRTDSGGGFRAPMRVNDLGPTISGPSWSTIGTGVLAHQHGVYDNYLHGHRMARHPDFLTRIRTALPGARTYAAADWPQLVRPVHGGPIFADGGYFPPGGDPGDDLAAWDRSGPAIAADAAAVLGAEDITGAFVCFGAPDAYGHTLGAGPEYRSCIEAVDAHVGTVLSAIAARPTADSEEWTVLAVTDHGHTDAGGHGGETPAERQSWLIAAGPGIPSEPPARLEQADVAVHAMTCVGVEPDPSWELAGRPLTDRRPISAGH